MSVDHKPGRKAEKRRIKRSGGFLDEGDPNHPRVVCEKLNVSHTSCVQRSQNHRSAARNNASSHGGRFQMDKHEMHPAGPNPFPGWVVVVFLKRSNLSGDVCDLCMGSIEAKNISYVQRSRVILYVHEYLRSYQKTLGAPVKSQLFRGNVALRIGAKK